MKLLTNAQSKRLDKIALKNYSIAGKSLMKNAGRCVSNLAISELKKVINPKILIICGKGNNGGDGFAAASILEPNNLLYDECHTSLRNLEQILMV